MNLIDFVKRDVCREEKGVEREIVEREGPCAVGDGA
jgi:hypothetical protein